MESTAPLSFKYQLSKNFFVGTTCPLRSPLSFRGPQLLEIKRGEWSLEKVREEADRLFKLAEESYVRSTLPAEPDAKAVNALVVGMIRDHFDATPR